MWCYHRAGCWERYFVLGICTQVLVSIMCEMDLGCSIPFTTWTSGHCYCQWVNVTISGTYANYKISWNRLRYVYMFAKFSLMMRSWSKFWHSKCWRARILGNVNPLATQNLGIDPTKSSKVWLQCQAYYTYIDVCCLPKTPKLIIMQIFFTHWVVV